MDDYPADSCVISPMAFLFYAGDSVTDEAREVRLNIMNTRQCKYLWDRDMSYRICARPENTNEKKGMCKVCLL